MNRPKIDNINQMSDYDLKNVIYQFEEYCDELEHNLIEKDNKIFRLSLQIRMKGHYIKIITDGNRKLKRALDKACQMVCDLIDAESCPDDENLSKDEWKKEFLKEVQDE